MRTFILIGTALLLATGTLAAVPDEIGRRRVLLVFAPNDADPGLALQRRIVDAAGEGMAERDVVLIRATGAATELRRRYRVDGPFVVLLIGKDGGEKLRATTPISADRLFDLIDAMPMRRSEIRR